MYPTVCPVLPAVYTVWVVNTALLTVLRAELRVFNPVPGEEEETRRRHLPVLPEEVLRPLLTVLTKKCCFDQKYPPK